MNRDEIWEHKDGSHWRILATDLKGPAIAAVCVDPRGNGSWIEGSLARHYDKDFTRQVRQPREFWVARAGQHSSWIEVTGHDPETIRMDHHEYIRVREVLDNES